ncbi:sensor histidine kinase [Clostridium sporogenes]|uniref:histidine kinase n=1 Tax=Clostridium botulinum TaxID=1491 RepID=A0A6M0SXQ4_CLOBO|nr:sensor histidine kinase [Clostridium sporogenes]NFA59883.1 HAMP domain-containing histidine kinase [Clostridium botulinum]NFI74044.1 HAMP domain-containing histidine kinase [Clostridium sporogenes]NFL71758.1 HAMP domain-containing histidine kinase [Clostridium sporogenes]NFM24614.1 HAMP domain-containing histidine kinase [Clostridium sporogenes]NFP61918.1 HAMP domain-containing histidine kinase [Clostridium sporogenes]
MNFIDFLKDRISYIIIYFISISLVILIMHLTLFIKVIDFPITNILYAYCVSIVILIIFLIYEYSKVRVFYKQLYRALNSEDIIEDIINVGEVRTREQKFFTRLLKKIHKTYEGKIYKYEDIQKHYSNFINQWVHQMKTPVSVINLILEEEDTAEFKEVFDSIGEENEKISQGLNIMLYNARINEFNHDFNVEGIDILLILRQVINDNKKLLIRNKIFPQITGETAIVQTDKKWIYFVINQIVINAIKYTVATERDKKTINFKIEEDTAKITVSIQDNGIGIPKEDLGRVFNAFFTGKNGRKTSESTGMGMYLAKRICNELGNELYVESEEGEGTIFYIIFYKGKNIFKL